MDHKHTAIWKNYMYIYIYFKPLQQWQYIIWPDFFYTILEDKTVNGVREHPSEEIPSVAVV